MAPEVSRDYDGYWVIMLLLWFLSCTLFLVKSKVEFPPLMVWYEKEKSYSKKKKLNILYFKKSLTIFDALTSKLK